MLLTGLAILVLLSFISYRPGDISLLQCPPNWPPDNFIGPVGAWLAFGTLMLLGVGGYLVPVLIGVQGLFMLLARRGRTWPKALEMLLVLITLVCLSELQQELWGPLTEKLNIGSPGGIIGYMLAQNVLILYLGQIGTAILAAVILVGSLVLLFEIQPVTFLRQVGTWCAALSGRLAALFAARREKRDEFAKERRELERERKRLEKAIKAGPPTLPSSRTRASEPETPVEEPKPKRKRKVRTKPKKEAPKPAPPPRPSVPSEYKLPPITLLDDPPPAKDRQIKGDFTTAARVLQETLAEFGITAEVTNVERGPVVTRYELLPAAGIKVEKIKGLSNNIALAMKATSVRIQAPIPGKGVVGIEVPNSKTTAVYLRELLSSDAWKNSSAGLPLALGKDVGGSDIVGDLAAMPHLLIAGATGAGKTVCMNSLLAGLLMSRTPDEMRLILVDPKIVEFATYNQLPHLVVPVITDPKKVSLGLRWAIKEMEKRYKLFAKAGVRNIQSYNARPVMKQEELFGEDAEEEQENQPPRTLPYIVIVVDELADLMMVAQAEIESGIARLAQLSRAVGIHMILATQRPSTNVITGTIKANFPARIAFQVAQKIDSRIILDANGADKLLGKGDMLYLPPGSSKLIRAQGCLTNDHEINAITEFLKEQGDPEYESEIKEKIESKKVVLPEQSEDDEMLDAAIQIIRQTQRASTSSLQRRLRIGYTRAARLMDILEEKGVVGPPRGSEPREILIDLDGEIPDNPEG